MSYKIAEGLEEGELLSQINQMIETLKKHERFVELEYKVRYRLTSQQKNYKNCSGYIIKSKNAFNLHPV